MPSYGRNTLTQKLVDWADLILVMEPQHKEQMQQCYKTKPDQIRVLNIPDIYFRNDPQLIHELKRKVVPILENWARQSSKLT